MKRIICIAALAAAALALALPDAQAQRNESGYSVHTKTPAKPAPATSSPTLQPQPEAAAPESAGQPDAVVAEKAAPADTPANDAAGQPEENTQAAAPEDGNALGVTEGWGAQFGTAPPQASEYSGTEDQAEIVQKINDYFNNMTNLEGQFLQTDANNDRKRGQFYIERPGKVLFDYALPSRQKIISNGEYLAIENHDLRTSDRYPLESTPFKLLLKEEVDLARDARIVALDVGENIAVLTVEDKESGGGQIRLFFDWPEIQLREWIITDAQGLNTRIQLAELEANKEADPKLFTFSKEIGLPQFRGGGN